MKTVYKFLVLGMLMIGFAIANTSTSFAQDDKKTELYTKFTACYKETDRAKRDACYAIAKQYLDEFEKDADDPAKFVRKKYDAFVKIRDKEALFDRFNKAVQNPVNPDEAFSAGKEIIAQQPELIDVPIVLASIGFDNASAKTPNDKYNGDTLSYARSVIQQLEGGKTCDQCGAYSYA